MESKHNDIDLYAGIWQGDQAAFTDLYNRYAPELLSIARAILDDNEVAKDIVQEAFLSLLERGAREIKNFRAYLYQSVKYQCFMHLRSGKISQKHLNRLATIMEQSYQQDYESSELSELLNKSIESLPDRCREVFYLSRFQQLSNKEIASQLHISHKTVENQITKALRTIKMSVDKVMMVVLYWLF